MSYACSLPQFDDLERRIIGIVSGVLVALSFSAVCFATESSIDVLIANKQYSQALPLIEKKLSKEPLSQTYLLEKARCLEATNQWEDVSSCLLLVGMQKDLTGQNLYDYCVLKLEDDKRNHEYAAAKQVCDTLIAIDPEHAGKWRALKRDLTAHVRKTK